MNKLKIWLEPTKNKVIAAVVACIIVFGGGYGLWTVFANKTVTMAPFTVQVAFEYSNVKITEADIRNEIRMMDDNNNPIEFEFVDFDETLFDVSKVSYKLTPELLKEIQSVKDDHNAWILKAVSNSPEIISVPLKIKGEGFEGEVEILYVVIDTQAPVLENPTKDITLEANKAFNPVYSKAKDVVDGEVDVTWVGEFDISKPGTYKMKEVAEDKNGNKTINEFTITVVEGKQEELPSTGGESNDDAIDNNTNNSNDSNNNSNDNGDTSNGGTGESGGDNSGNGDLGETIENECISYDGREMCGGEGTPPWEIID